MDEQPTDEGVPRRSVARLLFVATVLRPGIASLPPLIPLVREDLHLTAAAAASLSSLTLLLFGLGALGVPALTRHVSIDGLTAAALAALAVALGMRPWGDTALLLGGTLVAGLAVAVMNVVLPALVRRDVPAKVGILTGAYSTIFTGTAALATIAAVPLADHLPRGWRASLAFWALPAAGALVGWLGLRPRRPPQQASARPSSLPPRLRDTVRWPVAWFLAAFMGLQSLAYYATLAWLPSILQSLGLSPLAAAALPAIALAAGLPVSLLAPMWATRRAVQTAPVLLAAAATLLGIIGLVVLPHTLTTAWVLLIGVGQAATFPLALLLVTIRSRTVAETPSLGAFSQGAGYLLASIGPLMLGLTRDATGSWTSGLLVLAGCVVAQALSGALVASGRVGGLPVKGQVP